jgi:hypothetical protein
MANPRGKRHREPELAHRLAHLMPDLAELAELFQHMTERQRRSVLIAVRRLACKRSRRKDDTEHVQTRGDAADTIVERQAGSRKESR